MAISSDFTSLQFSSLPSASDPKQEKDLDVVQLNTVEVNLQNPDLGKNWEQIVSYPLFHEFAERTKQANCLTYFEYTQILVGPNKRTPIDEGIVTFRTKFRESFKQIIKKVSDLYLKKLKNILETDSGPVLNKPSYSYLVSFLPKSVRERIIQSDPNQTTVNHAKKKTKNYIKLDILAADLKHNAKYEAILGCSLFNFLKKDIQTCLTNMQSLLVDHGLFIHVNDLTPPISTLITEYSQDPDKIIFPLLRNDQSFEGVQCLSRKQIESKLDQFSPAQQDFLKKYLAVNSIQREIITLHHGYFLELFMEISVWINQNFAKECKVILLEEDFDQKIKVLLEEAEFKLLEFGVREEAVILDDAAQKINSSNCMINERGRRIKGFNATIPPKKLKQTSRVHVIVAQKLPSTQKK